MARREVKEKRERANFRSGKSSFALKSFAIASQYTVHMYISSCSATSREWFTYKYAIYISMKSGKSLQASRVTRSEDNTSIPMKSGKSVSHLGSQHCIRSTQQGEREAGQVFKMLLKVSS